MGKFFLSSYFFSTLPCCSILSLQLFCQLLYYFNFLSLYYFSPIFSSFPLLFLPFFVDLSLSLDFPTYYCLYFLLSIFSHYTSSFMFYVHSFPLYYIYLLLFFITTSLFLFPPLSHFSFPFSVYSLFFIYFLVLYSYISV